MTELAFYRRPIPFEPDQRHKFTAEDGWELAFFAAQCLGIVALAIVLYSVGPAVGLGLVATTIVVWTAVSRSSPETPESNSKQGDETRKGGRPLWQAT